MWIVSMARTLLHEASRVLPWRQPVTDPRLLTLGSQLLLRLRHYWQLSHDFGVLGKTRGYVPSMMARDHRTSFILTVAFS